MNILIRCDASHQIGIGHLSRCMTLASRLNEYPSVKIIFAIKKSDVAEKLLKNKFELLVFDSSRKHSYENWFIEILIQQKISQLILDVRNDVNGAFLKKIKPLTRIITIDDPEDKRLFSDLAFYPPVKQVMEMDWSNFKGCLKVGWEFVMIRDEFLNEINKTNNKKIKIIVSMGGSDALNLSLTILETLKKINIKFDISLIIGPANNNEGILKKHILDNQSLNVTVFNSPNNFNDLISESDFGIISFGQTAYEFAALNRPSIYLCLSEDHEFSSEIFVDSNFGISAGVVNKLDLIKLKSHIENMIINHLKFKKNLKKAKLANLFKSNNMIKLMLSND